MTPQKVLKTTKLIEMGPLWVWQNLWGYGRKVHAKFWLCGMPWDPSYDHFGSYVGPHFPNIGYFKVYEGI